MSENSNAPATNIDGEKLAMLPCCFCGGEPEIIHAYPLAVSCQSCGASGPVQTTQDDAIATWNQREWSDAHIKRLKFLMGQFQLHSPKMDGQHSYRFNNSGWPAWEMRGPSLEIAIDNAINAVEREKST